MAITTTYDGIEYRSRLEARWAAFMKNIGWPRSLAEAGAAAPISRA